MTVTIRFTTYERLMCVKCLNNIEGNMGILRAAIKLADLFELSKEEQSKIRMKTVGITSSWEDDTVQWDLELTEDQLHFLHHQVDNFTWAQAPARIITALGDKLDSYLKIAEVSPNGVAK